MNKEKPKTLNLSVEFGKTFENIGNSGFKKGKCKIAYAGKNRNYSDIPKEAFDNALKSLSLIPIVGNFKDGNFHGHDVAIELEGNDVKFKDLTSPIGVVPETHNAEWVDVEDENGNIKKYLECEVVFWFSRHEEPVQFIIDNGYVGQSMELDIINGDFTDDGYFKIEEFQFSALCLLGTDDEDASNDVEPCFEQSEVTISQFALKKDEFKSNFSLMMDELKSAYTEETSEKETDGDDSEVETETEEFENEENLNDDSNEADTNDEQDTDQESEEDTHDTEEDYSVIIEDLNLQIETLTSQVNSLSQENEDLKSNNEELNSFKEKTLKDEREIEENKLFDKYDELIDEEDESYKTIKESKSDFSIEQLKKELAFIFAEKQFNFSSNKNKNNNNLVKIGGDFQNTGEVSPYGSLFEKYQKNKEEK